MRRPSNGSSSGLCSTPGSASASFATSPGRTSSGSSASSGSRARAALTVRRPRSAWCRCRTACGHSWHHFALEKAFPVKTRRAQDIVKAVANRAGITKEVSPQVLRHTFAKMALQKGISLPTVQKILGHDSLQTTAIYLNFTDVHIQDEFERKW
ncbi:MAG: tyrosine-type recombinase/integrase [Isosphaeraceae bacterium]